MKQIRILKVVFACVLFAPLLYLGGSIWQEVQVPGSQFGADPGEAILFYLGEWAIRLLLIAFSISPLQKLFLGLPAFRTSLGLLFSRSRRMTGLIAFCYVSLHLLAYLYFFLQFQWSEMWHEFSERTYITVGLAAFVMLLGMALTSTQGWRRRLGRNWGRIHSLIYLAITLALIHLWWLTKDGYGELVLYTLWFLVLLILRYKSVMQLAFTKNPLNDR